MQTNKNSKIKKHYHSAPENLPESDEDIYQENPQLVETSDYSSSEEAYSEKPAKNALKKTFIGMLSKMQMSRQQVDTSSVSDIGSIGSKVRNRKKVMNAENPGEKLYRPNS